MARHPLEPEGAAMRAMGTAAVEFAARFVEERATAPAGGLPDAGGLVDALLTPPPDHGRSFDELLDIIGGAAAHAFDTTGPGYLAFIPGGGLYAAAVADYLACVTNRFVNLATPAPALVAIETSVVRWLCDVFGLPGSSLGILTSGGSLANFSAIVTARVDRLGEQFLAGTLYVTEHAHHSVQKAAQLAGFPARSVHTVACTPELRIDVDALRSAIHRDRAQGAQPFLVIASAGTTNTGAVDPIDDIADLCAAERLWLHVDAAYGGFFRLTDRGRARLAGIDRADSITVDPHKGMFLPYGTGGLLVREAAALQRAHHVGAHYLDDLVHTGGLPNFSDYSPELSRDFRGLRIWLPLHLHGVSAFRDALDEKLDLTETVEEGLRKIPGVDVPWSPDLSVVAFRAVPPAADPDDPSLDELNRGVLARINASGRIFLSSTVIGGRLILRVCVLSFRTHADRIDEAVAIIGDAVAGALAETAR
jgi:aromatic-L-amino-acid decarboxylase